MGIKLGLLAFATVILIASVAGNIYLLRNQQSLTKNITKLQNEINYSKSLTPTSENNSPQEDSGVRQEIDTINKKIECQTLITKTPNIGNIGWMNKNIVEFYKDAVKRYEEVKAGNFQRQDDPEDNKAEMEHVTEVLELAKPLYDAYVSKCGL